MLSLQLGIFSAGITLLAAYIWWESRRHWRVLRLSPEFRGPRTWPLIGSAYLFYGMSADNVFAIIGELYRIYGNCVTLWFGHRLSILMSDLADVECVLGGTQLLDKAFEYRFLQSWLREGLLVSRGRKWFKRRKVLTPAFHFKILEPYIEIFDRQSRVLLANMATGLSASICLGHWIHLCALDVICETAMGVSVHAQTNADSEYVRAVKTISTVLHKRMFDLLYRFDLTYMFTRLAREERRALHVLHSFTERIIVQRREELLRAEAHPAAETVGDAEAEARAADAADGDDVGAKRKMAFLDILLKSTIDDRPLTDLDIREEVDTFMFEGHDTTSSALLFFFYSIAQNPHCQRKCVEEILNVMGEDKTRPVTYELLNRLHYVELCVKETLRLYPSVPLLGRKVYTECEINGKTVPAGTNIGISPMHLGRREDLFPDALAFKPERFDVVTSAEKTNPYAYIPFSAGPRNCIGQKFAMLEIKAIVTNVLRHYEVEYVGEQAELVLVAELILRAKDPLMFRVKERAY